MSSTRGMSEVYRRRKSLHPPGYYSLFHPGQQYMTQRREAELLRLLSLEGLSTLKGLRILDLGCGGGEWMLRFQLYGSRPQDLVGIEIQSDRAREARARTRVGLVMEADAGRLPFVDGSFDLVHQSMVLTLVLQADRRQRIAREILRVLRPGGAVLWYDFRYSNPRNRDAHGIGRAEIRRLFPGCRMRLRSTTLVPMVARRLAPWTRAGCRLLELFPPARTHYLALIRAPGASDAARDAAAAIRPGR